MARNRRDYFIDLEKLMTMRPQIWQISFLWQLSIMEFNIALADHVKNFLSWVEIIFFISSKIDKAVYVHGYLSKRTAQP